MQTETGPQEGKARTTLFAHLSKCAYNLLLHSVSQQQEILASSTELFKEDPQSLFNVIPYFLN